MQQLVITDQVLPGPAGQLVTDGAVLIEDTTILAVGPRNQIEPMADASAQRRTFPDGTVLPGLINAHVHLSWGLALVVEEAHAAGLPIAAHAHGTDAIAAATAAGVDTLEHCSWQGRANSGADLRDAVVHEMAARKITVCYAYPPDWRTFQRVVVGEERSRAALDRLLWMDRHGTQFVPGTDAGLPTSVFDNYAGALTYYVDAAGWPPERVIEMARSSSRTRAATRRSASPRLRRGPPCRRW